MANAPTSKYGDISNIMQTISASKLQTLQKCSYLYYCRYGPWKLPQQTNDGARRGQVVHSLYECLLKPKRKKYYKQIIEHKSILGIPIIERFINDKMKREGLKEVDNKGQNNFDLIDQMILTGLLYDFYCESGKVEEAETEFLYQNKEIGYTIRGIVDKISKHNDKLRIWDYKTSSKVYDKKDLETNVQAMMYSLYAKRVRKMDAIVRFIFLRFPEQPLQEISFGKDVLSGFEQYLGYISNYLENFSIEDAYSNFAADQPYPKKDQGFCGRLLCGYGKFPGHKNKNGDEYYVCSYKWPFDYYALIDKETQKVIKTSFEEKDLKANARQMIEKRYYSGCPKFQ